MIVRFSALDLLGFIQHYCGFELDKDLGSTPLVSNKTNFLTLSMKVYQTKSFALHLSVFHLVSLGYYAYAYGYTSVDSQ